MTASGQHSPQRVIKGSPEIDIKQEEKTKVEIKKFSVPRSQLEELQIFRREEMRKGRSRSRNSIRDLRL